MELAVQSKLAFCRPNPRLDLMELARSLQICSLELEDDLSLSEPERHAIGRQLTRAGLEVFGLHVPCTCWSRIDRRFPNAKERIRQGVEHARQLNAKAIVLVPQAPSGVSIADAQASYADLSADALQLADPFGLGVSINNSGLHAAAFSHPGYFAELLNAHTPKLRMTLDVANCPLGGHCPEAAIQQLGPTLDVIHLKDWSIPQQQGPITGVSRLLAMQIRRTIMSSRLGDTARKVAAWLGVSRHIPRVVRGTDGIWYQGTTIGDGMVDIPRCLERLQQIGFSGYLCIEYEGTGDLESALRSGVTRVRSMLTSICATASTRPTGTHKHSAP